MLATAFTDPFRDDPANGELKNSGQGDEQNIQQSLLDIIGRIHVDFPACHHVSEAYERLLPALLSLLQGTHGFIGEVSKSRDGGIRLQPLAISNSLPESEWSVVTALQEVAHTGQSQISKINNTTTFIGLPVIFQQEILVVIGVVSTTTVYTKDTIHFLQPLLQVLGFQHVNAQAVRHYQQLKQQHAIQQSEWEALMLTLDDIVFEMDDQKTFTKVWCSQESLLFRPREEVIGKTISEVLGHHAMAFNRLADKILRTGETQQYIYPDIRQGLEHWYEIKMALIKSPGPKRIFILIRNISARERQHIGYQQAQSELKRSNQLLGICQQMGKMGGWEFNVVTGEIYWTKEIYALREVPPGYPITLQGAASFYHPDDQPMFNAAKERLFNEQIPFDLEIRQISAKGKETWVRSVGKPVFNSNGQLTHFRGIIMDITDKKDNELALTNARDNAQKAAQARSEFLSVMSHEIRTPLNAIIGIANILEGSTVPEGADIIPSLQFSANHLLGLINDILDFSKMESGKIELEKIHFDLTRLVQGISNNYLPLTKNKGIAFYTHIDKRLPAQVTGDPVRLSQILNNLLSNAIKFTKEGSVTISVHQEAITHNNCRISFQVKDTGIGIVPEMHDKIFETFVQEDSATTRHHGGTGLGLAITKKLVTLHNSDITLDSKKNEGTSFRFEVEFPVPETDANQSHQQAIHAPGFLEGMRLLVVEDNAINIRIIGLQLKKSGVTIVNASNGRQALEKMQEQSFDGVVLDLHMPEMNGYATIPHIQHLQPQAFIIVLTADVMPEVKERLALLQVKDMLPKPYAAEDLLRMLAQYRKE
ncbi:MAG: response regulator [Chitinophaga sp.]|uniref:hybrid sensor histidine kinase/response regulator n=1 Tax=Chitinophaga sp. TaxID=1869181 RepID=UPI001B1FB7BB|nr:PAS domain-containing hybrid sensor histidine kinase/response regulator [Chitinophaga sp.]MBO9731977.1 response regulator [Chitinophaga sp.]